MLFSVNDDSSNLLVHEDEDGAEKSRNRCCQDGPPRVASYRVDQPASVISGRLEKNVTEQWGRTLTMTGSLCQSVSLLCSPYLEFAGNLQLLWRNSNGVVKQNHDGDGEEHGKVADHGSHLDRNIESADVDAAWAA